MSNAGHRYAQRISRRTFLAGSVVAAAAGAGAAVIGCRRGRRAKPASTSPAAMPSLAPAAARGGVLRTYSFDAMIEDTLDPHLTQMGPVQNMHSAVFSKLLQFADERASTIAPDLADGMPERPDKLTYVVRLRAGVKFHDTLAFRLAHPKAAGRELDASDVKYSIERQLNRNSPQSKRFFRQSDWTPIDRIDMRDSHTIVIATKTPVAPFLSFLAGRHAFIIPREVVDANDEAKRDLDMIGSGPFILDTWQPGSVVKLRRNPQWFARDDSLDGFGAGRPFLDGYDAFLSPQEDVFQQVAFEHRRVDMTGFQEPAALDREHKTNLYDIILEQVGAGGIMASRLLLDRPPFKDDRVRRAIHLAINRRALADLLYPALADQPSALLSGAVAPVMERFAIPQDELSKRPGYRTDPAGRADDLRNAKQLWSAAFGGQPPKELRITFAGVPKLIPDKAPAAIAGQLRAALGVTIVPLTDLSGYALTAAALRRNVDGATEGVVSFTFGFEDGGVDLDDWVYPHFRSGQPANTYRLQDPTLDAMLDKSRGEFDTKARRRTGRDIQEYLIGQVNARLDYFAPVARRLTWGYVRNTYMPIWHGSYYKLADTWLDTSHPAWKERQV